MVNHSPILFLLFSLFFYSHFNRAFDDAEHSPVGIQERARLLTETDQCVLKYLSGVAHDKKLRLLPYVVKRCSLAEYFSLEEFGNRLNNSLIHSFFPLFQHSHLRRCNSFLFFGTSSYDMSAELEIINNVDFGMSHCKYLILDKRKNIHGLKNFVHVPELTETQLNDILLQYKDDKDYIIEHLYIAEMKDIELFLDKILKLRNIYSLTICQITVRLPHLISKEDRWKFSENILKNDNYALLDVQLMENHTQFYLFGSNEYPCMMRYV
ncbi:unnamed protein product [Caenorhabditis brenneri]